MRGRVLALLLVVSSGVAGSAVAAPPGTGSQGSPGPEALEVPVQYWGGSYCDRLRRACEYKEYRGESGEGNCRRYRERCEGDSYCRRLRRACFNKEERGEVGEGNCRRYRAECGR